MKILFADEDVALQNLFEHLNSLNRFEVDICENLECGKVSYTQNRYDLVIVDMDLEFNKKLLSYVLDINPMQKIITTGMKLEYSEKKGCDFCQLNYNKKRLLKPIELSQLITFIKQLDTSKCKCMNKLDNKEGLVEIMGDVVRRFSLAKYNSDNKSISFNGTNSLINMSNFLEDKKIKFLIDELDSIQIKE